MIDNSSARLKTILDSIPDILVEVNENKIYTWANQHAYDFFGADMLGKEASFYFEEDQSVYEQVAPIFQGSDKTIYVESWQRRSDGQKRLLAWWSHVLINDQGQVIGALSTARDITDKLKSETSQQILQKIIDLLPVRIFWKDSNLRYLGCNKVFAQDAGKSTPAELVGQDDFQMGWKDQADLYREDDFKVIQSGVSKINYEEPQTTPGGGTIWLITNKVPLTDGSGKIMGVVGTYSDITIQKNAQEQIKQSEEKLRKAQSISHVGNWEFSLSTNMVTGSEESYLIYGLDSYPDEFPLEQVQAIVLPQYRPQMEQAITALINEGAEYKQKYQIKRVNDGQIRFIYSIAELVRNQSGQPEKILGTIQDMTELTSAENQLRTKNDELEKMNTLMVNRELKMVELKEKIKALEAKLQPT